MSTHDALADQLTALLARLPKEGASTAGESDVDSSNQHSSTNSSFENQAPYFPPHHHHSLLHLEVNPGEVSLGASSLASMLSARTQNSQVASSSEGGGAQRSGIVTVSFSPIFVLSLSLLFPRACLYTRGRATILYYKVSSGVPI